MHRLLLQAHKQPGVQHRISGINSLYIMGSWVKFLTDQGCNFESDLLKALYELSHR